MPRGLKRQLDTVNEKLTAGEYSSASQEATEASKSIMDGINRLGRGDKMGGAASLLEGLGQLT